MLLHLWESTHAKVHQVLYACMKQFIFHPNKMMSFLKSSTYRCRYVSVPLKPAKPLLKRYKLIFCKWPLPIAAVVLGQPPRSPRPSADLRFWGCQKIMEIGDGLQVANTGGG